MVDDLIWALRDKSIHPIEVDHQLFLKHDCQ
jgi:hypothetical protein